MVGSDCEMTSDIVARGGLVTRSLSFKGQSSKWLQECHGLSL